MTERIECLECGKLVTPEIEERLEVLPVRGEPTEVLARVGVCPECHAEMSIEVLDNETLVSAFDRYRRKHGLMTPEEMQRLRERYGLGVRAFSLLLGWGEITLHRYESGSLQDGAHEAALRMAEDPANIPVFLTANGHKLTTRQRARLEARLMTIDVGNRSCSAGPDERFVIREETGEYGGRLRMRPAVAIPPGETISEMLQERHITQSDFALMLGRTEKNVSLLVNGKAPISHEFAIDLERVLGVSASFWNSLEATYRDLMARRLNSEQREHEAAWAKDFPLKRLEQEGFIAREVSADERPGQLLGFFGVASPEAFERFWSSPRRLAACATGAHKADMPALATWLRLGEIAARDVETGPFDSRLFGAVVSEAHARTCEPADSAFRAIQESSARAGVAVVLVKALPKTSCNGVTRWIADDKALIQLCLQHKTADQLWFSFFHEACHVLMHGRKRTYVQGMADRSVEEAEANAFAARMLSGSRHPAT